LQSLTVSLQNQEKLYAYDGLPEQEGSCKYGINILLDLKNRPNEIESGS
jgi:hypothetical protein